MSREFPEGASMLEGVERRSFVKLMAASFGLAGLGMTGCRRPEHVILPYGKSPEELIWRTCFLCNFSSNWAGVSASYS